MFVHPDGYQTRFKVLFSKYDLLWVAFVHECGIQKRQLFPVI